MLHGYEAIGSRSRPRSGVLQAFAMFDRITFDLRILGGRASIRGMRIPVSVLVSQMAHGATWDEVLADYPDLEVEDLQQALAYAAWLTREEVVPA
jgi:uncharacterized protein (DUF433 family)